MGRCSQFSLQIVRTVVISLPVAIFGDQPIGPDFRSSVWEQTRSNQPCRSRQLVRSATRISSRFLSSGCRGGSSRHCWTVGVGSLSARSRLPAEPPAAHNPFAVQKPDFVERDPLAQHANLGFNMHTCVFEMQTLWLALGFNMHRWVFGVQTCSTCKVGFPRCKHASRARALHLGNPTLHVERHSPFSLAFGAMPFMKSRSKLFRSRLQIRSRTFNSPSNCFPFAGNISSDVFVRIYCIKRSPAIWCASPPIGASVQNDEDHKCSNFELWPIPTLRSHKKVCVRSLAVP